MNDNKPLLNKEDTKLFLKKSNKLIRFLRKEIFISFLKRDFAKRDRYKERMKSLIANKKRNEYPNGFIANNERVAVYTVIYGNYDGVKPIKTKNPNCDYYIFTDQPVPLDSGWEKKEFNFPKEIKDDPILKNRYLKMHPHLLFPNHKYSIYLDGVFIIDLDIYRLMTRLGEHIIGLFDHHQKADCLYEEGEVLKKIKKAPSEIIDKQLGRYMEEGFPKHFGFCECGLIIRKHHENKCKVIMNSWWDEFLKGVKRDQLSFMYCIWKSGLTKKDIAWLGATFWDEPITPSLGHNAK